jgi:peptidyl-prolyl cis-trans isomerase D
MLDTIRKSTGSWFIKFILGIIVIVFIFWGIGSFRSQRLNVLTRVNGEDILVESYSHAYANLLDNYKQMFGGQIPEGFLERIDIKQQVLNGLINETLIRQATDKMGILVSDIEVQNIILNIPAFKHNGVFDQRLYERSLSSARLTPAAFEAQVRQQLLTDKLKTLLFSGLAVTEAEAKEHYIYENDEVNLAYVSINASECEAEVNATKQDLTFWYESHSENYKTEPQIKLRYLVLNESDIDDANVTDLEIEAYYQEHRTEVKNSIATKLKAQKAKNMIWDRANKAYDDIIQLGSLSAYAEQHEIELESTGLFSQKKPPAVIGGDPELLKTLFALNSGELSSLLQIHQGILITEVLEKKAPYLPSLEEVKDQVKKDYVREKAKELCRMKAQGLLEAAKKQGLEAASKDKGLKIQQTGFFKRTDKTAKGELPSTVAQAGISLYEGKAYPDEVAENGNSFYILAFKEKKDADIAGFPAQKDAITKRILEQKQQTLFEDWLKHLRERASIKQVTKI